MNCLFLSDFTNDCVWRISPWQSSNSRISMIRRSVTSNNSSLTVHYSARSPGSNASFGSNSSTSFLSLATNALTDDLDEVDGENQITFNQKLAEYPLIKRFAPAFGEPWTLSVSAAGELFQIWTDSSPMSLSSANRDGDGPLRSETAIVVPETLKVNDDCSHNANGGGGHLTNPPSVICRSCLLVYSADGNLDRAATLPCDVDHPHHVVRSSRGTLYVSHGFGDGLHRVCEVRYRSYDFIAGSRLADRAQSRTC